MILRKNISVCIFFICLLVIYLLASNNISYAQKMAIPSLRAKIVDSLEKILRDSEQDTVRVKALNHLSFHYLEISDEPTQGNEYAEEALKLAEELNFKEGEAWSYAILADYERRKHFYQKSLDLSTKSFAIAQNLENNKVITGYLFFIQSGIFTALGDYPKALDYAMKSLNIRTEVDKESQEVAESYNLQGRIYASMKKYTMSLDFFQKSLVIYEKHGNQEQMAKLLNNIGDTYIKLENPDEALVFQLKSLKLNESLASESGKATNYITIGEIYEQKQDYKAALDYYEKALIIDTKLGGKYEIAYDYNNLGGIYTKIGEYENAKMYFEKAQKTAEEIGYKEEIMRTYQGLSNLYAQIKDFENAYLYYQKYFNLHDSVFGDENTEKVNNILSDIKMEQKQAEIELLNKDKIIQEEENKINSIFMYSLLGGFLSLATLAFILIRNNRLAKMTNKRLLEQKEEIERQKDDIEEKNKDITSSIRYAKHIQEAMLPFPERMSKALNDYFILFKPRDIVSGDFYWFEEIEPRPIYKEIFNEKGLESILIGFSNAKIVVAAVDCTGHGVPGAFMSMIGNDLLGHIINERGIVEPDKILSELHEGIQYSLRQKESHNDDGMDIAICVIDKTDKTIEFAGAKSHLVVLQENELVEIRGNPKSIGGLQKENNPIFTKNVISIEKPTVIYLFSDGYQDQFSGQKREKFKRTKLKQLLKEIHRETLTTQQQILDDTFEKWKGEDNTQIDDVMIIGISIDLEKETPSNLEKLKA